MHAVYLPTLPSASCSTSRPCSRSEGRPGRPGQLRSSLQACTVAASLAGAQAARSRYAERARWRGRAQVNSKRSKRKANALKLQDTDGDIWDQIRIEGGQDDALSLESPNLKVEDNSQTKRAVRPNELLAEVLPLLQGKIPPENISGLSTGWPEVDQMYKPVLGELTVVSGTPGSGKSEWLLSMAVNMARLHNWRFATCMFEHKLEDYAIQLLEKAQSTRYKDLKGKTLDWKFLDDHIKPVGSFSQELTMDQILEAGQYLVDSYKEEPNSGKNKPQGKAQQGKNKPQGKAQQGLHGLIIDPYNYIEREDAYVMTNETDYISIMLTKVKKWAAVNNVHVWIVVHPAKGSNTTLLGRQRSAASKKKDVMPPVPTLYDCSGSAHWYNKADMGIIIERNRDPQVADPRLVKVHAVKVRNSHAGEVGNVPLLYDWDTRSYADEKRHCEDRVWDGKSK